MLGKRLVHVYDKVHYLTPGVIFVGVIYHDVVDSSLCGFRNMNGRHD